MDDVLPDRGAPVTAGQLEGLQRAIVHANPVLRAQITPAGDSNGLWLAWPDTSPPGSTSRVDVDLSVVPSEHHLRLALKSGPVAYHLTGLAPGAVVVIDGQVDNLLRGPQVLIGAAISGAVIFQSGPDGEVTLEVLDKEPPEAQRLILSSGDLQAGDGGFPFELEVVGESPERSPRLSGNFDRVKLHGWVQLPQGRDDGEVQTLILASKASGVLVNTLGLVGEVRPLQVETSTLTIAEAPDSPIRSDSSLDPTAVLKVKNVDGLRLTGHRAAVTIAQNIANATIVGKLHLRLLPKAVAESVRFQSAHETDEESGKESLYHPRLRAHPNSLASDLTGSLVLSSCERASIAGSVERGITIHGIERADFDKSDRQLNSGLVLSNFTIPTGSDGRLVLDDLEGAHRLEPFTRDLAVWDSPYRLTFRSTVTRLGERLSGRERRVAPPLGPHVLKFEAERLRKLSELASAKGASGGARTKIGWCSQRLRHESTVGRAERFWLWVYRLLGYGERPGPAFATWIALSLLLAFILALPDGLSWDPVTGARLWLERAISPVGSITGSGSAPEDGSWLYLARALAAIPLVVGALALRKYVRQG